jgi:fibronectin type 3 domain-containing protein
VPAGLTALVEPHAVQLVWDAVEAADLAGYKIYRTEGSGIEKLVAVATIPMTPEPITATTFRDTTIHVGISYYYEVTSIDKSGNESKRAKTDWVLAPKTP